MRRKIISFTLCLCITVQLLPTAAYSKDISKHDENTLNFEAKDEILVDEDILDIASYTAVGTRTVNDILAQSKFTASQGHGFAAERGNNLIDAIKGKNTNVVGDNNVKNGPDRLILERDGTKIWIQDKYYADAKAGINACFDATGRFRYYDGDGNAMQIEVPKDQYADAVKYMREKIVEGKIDGITNPDDAETLVRKGALTYKQAQNLAKAGTLESLTYDAANGVITAGCSFGISVLLNYSVSRLNGDTRKEAIKFATEEGIKTGGLVFCSSVIAGQLTKTGLMNVFKPSSEALVKALGDDFAKALVNATGGAISGEVTTQTLTQQAAKVLRAQALATTVTIVVFSVPDAVDLFSGRISQKQFVKNFAVTAVTIVAGTAGSAGGGFLGNLIVPGVGSVPGSIIGAVLASGFGGWATDKLADYITDDDADEMYLIAQDSFAQKCEDYLVTETEAQEIVDQFNAMLDEDMFKDMYQSKNREQFITNKLNPLFTRVVSLRSKIETPTEDELRESLIENLKGVVFIH